MEWEVWLEKVDIQTSIVDWTEKPKKKVKFREDDDKGGAWEDSGYAKNASWESWLDKNNGIETSHKDGEKKVEWDGKFSSSTIEDEVKNEDEKSNSEEESLEELTDGKLEEIEKLKSWEDWLEKDALTNRWIETIPKKPRNNSMEDSQSYSRQSTGARYEQDPRGKRSASSIRWSKLGDLGEINYKKILNDEGEETDKWVKNTNAGGSKSNALAHGNKKRQQNAATKKPTPPTGEAPTGVGKSWEAWLTKYEETLEDKKLALQLNERRAVNDKKIAQQKVKPETGEDAKMGEYSSITAEKLASVELFLDKMQGVGDARFGNQHLTGLDQKPVNNEEDEANILPEKDEKTDDKEEKEEITDNKPYKALGEE